MRQEVRKITKHGPGSLGVVLPREILRSLGWREHQRVAVKRVARGVLIIDALTKHRKKK